MDVDLEQIETMLDKLDKLDEEIEFLNKEKHLRQSDLIKHLLDMGIYEGFSLNRLKLRRFIIKQNKKQMNF